MDHRDKCPPGAEKDSKVMDFEESQVSARRAGQTGGMEESASHHVNDHEMCFLVRLRRRKCYFEASGPSLVYFFRFPDTF